MHKGTVSKHRHLATQIFHVDDGYFNEKGQSNVTPGYVITSLDTQGHWTWSAGTPGPQGPPGPPGPGGSIDLWGYFTDTGGLNNTMAPSHNAVDPNGTGTISDSNWVAPYPNQSTEANGKMMLFDYNKSAFRAGRVTGNRWVNANRGADSIGLGFNPTAASDRSISLGPNICDAVDSITAGGTGNNINGAGTESSGIFSGNLNLIQGTSAAYSAVAGGQSIKILDNSAWTGALGGQGNEFHDSSIHCGAIGGQDNILSGNSTSSVFIGGISGIITNSQSSAVIASQPTKLPLFPFGTGNPKITGTSYASAILASQNTLIDAATQCAIIGCSGSFPTPLGSTGDCHITVSSYGSVLEAAATSFIESGDFCNIAGCRDSKITGCIECTIAGSGSNAGVGDTHITNATRCNILGGRQTIIENSVNSTIAGTIGSLPGGAAILYGTQCGMFGGVNSKITSDSTVGNNNQCFLFGGNGCLIRGGPSITGACNSVSMINSISSTANGASNGMIINSNNSTLTYATQYCLINSGSDNEITAPAFNSNSTNYCTILNGAQSSIGADAGNAGYNFTGNGQTNIIFADVGDVLNCQILNGIGNTILTQGSGNFAFSSIGNGQSNLLQSQPGYSAVANQCDIFNGTSNTIDLTMDATYCTILNGNACHITSPVGGGGSAGGFNYTSTILNGENNNIISRDGGSFGFHLIGNGSDCTISGDNSYFYNSIICGNAVSLETCNNCFVGYAGGCTITTSNNSGFFIAGASDIGGSTYASVLLGTGNVLTACTQTIILNGENNNVGTSNMISVSARAVTVSGSDNTVLLSSEGSDCTANTSAFISSVNSKIKGGSTFCNVTGDTNRIGIDETDVTESNCPRCTVVNGTQNVIDESSSECVVINGLHNLVHGCTNVTVQGNQAIMQSSQNSASFASESTNIENSINCFTCASTSAGIVNNSQQCAILGGTTSGIGKTAGCVYCTIVNGTGSAISDTSERCTIINGEGCTVQSFSSHVVAEGKNVNVSGSSHCDVSGSGVTLLNCQYGLNKAADSTTFTDIIRSAVLASSASEMVGTQRSVIMASDASFIKFGSIGCAVLGGSTQHIGETTNSIYSTIINGESNLIDGGSTNLIMGSVNSMVENCNNNMTFGNNNKFYAGSTGNFVAGYNHSMGVTTATAATYQNTFGDSVRVDNQSNNFNYNDGAVGVLTVTSGRTFNVAATNGITHQTRGGEKIYDMGVAGVPANTGTILADAAAILDLQSTRKGFLPPRMTNAQRLAIAAPPNGLMVYCTDVTEGLYVRKSTGWFFVV